jgi:glycopeptide antibiotics resistance protein
MLFGEVPSLPVVVPAAVVVFGVLVWRLRRRGALSPVRVALAACACVYGAGVVANTVFPIYLDMPGGSQPWSSSISVRPFVDYELADAIENVIVFLPVGVLVALAAARSSLARAVAVGALFSLLIETTQFFSAHLWHGGHVADINDLFFNVVGAMAGCGLVAGARRLSRSVRRVRPAGSTSGADSRD